MVLKYLGTAAAEGMPAVFCNCELCTNTRKYGGKNVRTRSQILIDKSTLIDFPMDSYLHALRYGIDLSAISDVFITHAHMDHCYPQDFIMRCPPYAHNMTLEKVNVYGDEAVVEKFKTHTADEIKPAALESIGLNILSPYDVVDTANGMRVTALPACHTVGENCLLYAAQRDGKTALIMNDTGILDESVYRRMKDMGMKFDLVSFDCTYGAHGHGKGRHMGLPDNVGERDKMKAFGLVDDGTKYIITHFSHNNGLLHDDRAAIAEKFGMTAAYDGMEVEI